VLQGKDPKQALTDAAASLTQPIKDYNDSVK
jgi:sn-glycerol 3-phosphate transport system substrate-binding protein